MRETVSFHIMSLYRDFLSYTTGILKAHGVSFGQMPLILYIGKHPGCSQAQLTKELHLDWGHSQRSITKLAGCGLIQKEYSEAQSCHSLVLTETGQTVFEACHQVFSSWDRQKTAALTEEEAETLLSLLGKLSEHTKEGQ